MRYFLFISYLGTRYHGWQYQKNAVGVQNVIQDKLSLIFRKPLNIIGSSRTDTGVHARMQCAHVDLEDDIDIGNIVYKLNSILPDDISILDIRRVSDTAHARFDAISRKYCYYIGHNKNAICGSTAYWLPQKLDIGLVNNAMKIIQKTINFETFSKVMLDLKHGYECRIFDAHCEYSENNTTFHITANRFLRGMVRSIVGNIISVGLRKTTIDEFIKIIRCHDRTKSLGLVPPQGLILEQIEYYDNIFV